MKIFSKRCIIPIEDNHLLKIEQSSFIGKDEDEKCCFDEEIL